MLTKMILLTPNDFEAIKNEYLGTSNVVSNQKIPKKMSKAEILRDWMQIRSGLVQDNLQRRKNLRDFQRLDKHETVVKKVKKEEKTPSEGENEEDSFFTGSEGEDENMTSPQPDAKRKLFETPKDGEKEKSGKTSKSKSRRMRRKKRKLEADPERVATLRERKRKKNQSGQGKSFKFIRKWESF